MTVYGSCNVNGQQIDRVKKNFIQLLKDVGFLIDVCHFCNYYTIFSTNLFTEVQFYKVKKQASKLGNL